MTLIINSPNVVSSQGVPISVTGVAQVKINGSSDEMLKAAAEQFGDKSTEEIMHSKYLRQAKNFEATPHSAFPSEWSEPLLVAVSEGWNRFPLM